MTKGKAGVSVNSQDLNKKNMILNILDRRVLFHSQVPKVSKDILLMNRNFHVSVRLNDVYLSKNPFACGGQKRTMTAQKQTMKALLSHLSSMMIERVLKDPYKNQRLILPVAVCSKPKEFHVHIENRIYYPFLRKAPPLSSMKEDNLYVLRFKKFWRERRFHQFWRERLIYLTDIHLLEKESLARQALLKEAFSRQALLKEALSREALSREALSSKIDFRTSFFFCILFSITVLMEISPEPLLNKPDAIFSENFQDVMNYVRNTYVNHVCTTHKTPSPCECGEPINRIVREIIPQTSFDPLEKLEKPTPGRVKTITYTLGTILLLITLMDKTGSEHFI